MPVIRFRERQPFYGVELFKDLRKTLKIETPIIDTPNSDIYGLPANLPGMRVADIYEFTGGVWVKLTAYKLTRRRVIFPATVSNQIMIVPRSYVSLLQTGLKPSSPVRVFCKAAPGYTIKNVSITSYDYEAATTGPFLFSETVDGVYEATINPTSFPPFFYVKSKLTAKGVKSTVPLVITSDVYL